RPGWDPAHGTTLAPAGPASVSRAGGTLAGWLAAASRDGGSSMIARDDSGAAPYRAGMPVPRSAKYAGLHQGHHLPFQIMLLSGGGRSPGGPRCGDAAASPGVARARRRDRPPTGRSDSRLRAV